MRRRIVDGRTLLTVGAAAGLIVVFVLAAGATGRFSADAQDTRPVAAGTPATLNLPAIPQPHECIVPPMVLADLAGLSATPMSLDELAPPTPPAELAQATPADAATSAAVLAVVRESIACSNAGDLARGFGLVTDGYLRRRVIAIAGPFDEAVYGTVATPMPLPSDRYITLVSVGPVVILPDGRAAVEVVASDVRTRRSIVVLALTPAGWRLDELIPLEDSPAPVATPEV